MDSPVERPDSSIDKQLEYIKGVADRVFEQRGAPAALQLVASLQRKMFPTLPKLSTPHPANPQTRIEEADALIIGPRIIESSRRRQGVTLVALFPETSPFVEFRSYRQVIPELVPGSNLSPTHWRTAFIKTLKTG